MTDASSESERVGANARASVGGERRGGQRRRSSSRRGRPLWSSPGGDGEINGLEGEGGVEGEVEEGGGGKDEGDSDAKVRGVCAKPTIVFVGVLNMYLACGRRPPYPWLFPPALVRR